METGNKDIFQVSFPGENLHYLPASYRKKCDSRSGMKIGAHASARAHFRIIFVFLGVHCCCAGIHEAIWSVILKSRAWWKQFHKKGKGSFACHSVSEWMNKWIKINTWHIKTSRQNLACSQCLVGTRLFRQLSKIKLFSESEWKARHTFFYVFEVHYFMSFGGYGLFLAITIFYLPTDWLH